MRVVYLLLGNEQGLKEAYIEDLLVKINTLKSEPWVVSKFFLSELSAIELSEKLLNNSLFAKRELFIIYESELLKTKKDLELVCNTLSKVINKTVIFISNKNICDLNCKNNNFKVIKKVFYGLSDKDIYFFIERGFGELGIKITSSAINLMILMIIPDTRLLKFYIKSFSILSKSKFIDEDDVRKWISFIRVENVFSLFDSILKKDMVHSLIKIKSILENGEDFLNILMSLIWQFKRFLKVQIDFKILDSLQSAFNKNNIFSSLNEIYKIGIKNYSILDVRIILKILYKFDLFLRLYPQTVHQNLAYFLIFSLLRLSDNIVRNVSSEFEFNF